MSDDNSEKGGIARDLADAAADQRVGSVVMLGFVLNFAGFFPDSISAATFAGLFAIVFAMNSLTR